MSIVHALSHTIHNKQEGKKLGENLKKLVESKFSVKTMTRETVKIYLDS